MAIFDPLGHLGVVERLNTQNYLNMANLHQITLDTALRTNVDPSQAVRNRRSMIERYRMSIHPPPHAVFADPDQPDYRLLTNNAQVEEARRQVETQLLVWYNRPAVDQTWQTTVGQLEQRLEALRTRIIDLTRERQNEGIRGLKSKLKLQQEEDARAGVVDEDNEPPSIAKSRRQLQATLDKYNSKIRREQAESPRRMAEISRLDRQLSDEEESPPSPVSSSAGASIISENLSHYTPPPSPRPPSSEHDAFADQVSNPPPTPRPRRAARTLVLRPPSTRSSATKVSNPPPTPRRAPRRVAPTLVLRPQSTRSSSTFAPPRPVTRPTATVVLPPANSNFQPYIPQAHPPFPALPFNTAQRLAATIRREGLTTAQGLQLALQHISVHLDVIQSDRPNNGPSNHYDSEPSTSAGGGSQYVPWSRSADLGPYANYSRDSLDQGMRELLETLLITAERDAGLRQDGPTVRAYDRSFNQDELHYRAYSRASNGLAEWEEECRRQTQHYLDTRPKTLVYTKKARMGPEMTPTPTRTRKTRTKTSTTEIIKEYGRKRSSRTTKKTRQRPSKPTKDSASSDSDAEEPQRRSRTPDPPVQKPNRRRRRRDDDDDDEDKDPEYRPQQKMGRRALVV